MSQLQDTMYRDTPMVIRDVTAQQFAVQSVNTNQGIIFRVDGVLYVPQPTGGYRAMPQISTDANGNVTLMGLDGVEYAIADYAATLFADLPDPTTVQAGVPYYVSDVGVGGSQWYSDGTRWRAVSGSVVIGSVLVAANAYASEAVAASFAIPAGLVRDGDKLEFLCSIDKSGTTDTFTRNYKFGSANTTADTLLVTNNQPATTVRKINDMQLVKRKSEFLLGILSNASIGGVGTTTTALSSGITVADMDTQTTYASLTLVKQAGAAGETVTVEDFSVILHTCGN
jgi:hypothetical protein